MRLMVRVQGYKCDERRAGVPALTGKNIFGEHLDSYFHRRAKHAVDARLQDDPLAHANGKTKIEIVHGRGDHMAIGVAIGRKRSGDINQVHYSAAEHVAEQVGVVWQDDFDDLRSRCLYRLTRQPGFGEDFGRRFARFFTVRFRFFRHFAGRRSLREFSLPPKALRPWRESLSSL